MRRRYGAARAQSEGVRSRWNVCTTSRGVLVVRPRNGVHRVKDRSTSTPVMGVMCDMKCAHKTGPALDNGVALDKRGEEEGERLRPGEFGPDVVEGDVTPGLADEGAGEVGAAAVEGEDVAEDLDGQSLYRRCIYAYSAGARSMIGSLEYRIAHEMVGVT